MDRRVKANRDLWDAWTRIHRSSAFYDVDGFLAGRDPLNPLEVEELGPVAGKRLLHLQCHFGMDSLGWARRGALVTGVDFSPEAIGTARRLAADAGLEAEFIEADVYRLGEEGLAPYDIVYTSYGVLPWLPDLALWGKVVASHLARGGVFYMVEFHPLAAALDDDGARIRWPYLATGAPLELRAEGSYADPAAEVSLPSYEWPHGLGDVVTALTGAGLRLEFLREHPRVPYGVLPFLERRPDGSYGMRGGSDALPLLFSLRAVRE